jgi:hypothetical protein
MKRSFDHSPATWFETRGVATLLTMRVYDPHPEEAQSAVSKDEATAPRIGLTA